jgi:hypothetical protein
MSHAKDSLRRLAYPWSGFPTRGAPLQGRLCRPRFHPGGTAGATVRLGRNSWGNRFNHPSLTLFTENKSEIKILQSGVYFPGFDRAPDRVFPRFRGVRGFPSPRHSLPRRTLIRSTPGSPGDFSDQL